MSEVKRLNVPVRREGVALRREDVFREISFEVIPIISPANNRTSFLILFAEQEQTSQTAPKLLLTEHSSVVQLDETTAEQRELTQLRNELAAATNYVQSLVEQNHALAEQLTGAEEESQSTSEEYRSTNEELQTAKEEVESSNEELITINDELRAANEDLAKASQILHSSGEFTSAIVESMRHPMLVLDAKMRVESANKAFYDDFQVTAQESVGQLIYQLGNGEWNIPELRQLLEHILPNHSTFDDYSVTHKFPHIGIRTMLLNAHRLTGIDSQPGRIVLVIADFTEETRIKKELQEISNDLKRSNEELDQFAAVASHDLQEPLRMISSYVTLLQHKYNPLFDDQARNYMEFIVSGAKRMTAMIKAILAYSQLGHKVSGLSEIDSAVKLKYAIADLKVRVEESRATIVEGALPRVFANQAELTQLFQNLLSNAMKFRDHQRSLVITINATESEHYWTFAITDNGMGIKQDQCESIFHLFKRVHQDRSIEGGGIGLATCKKIVEHHGGRIWVESKFDVGSTFYFTLPKY
jgi:two-component system CheB/CheR fusion protein